MGKVILNKKAIQWSTVPETLTIDSLGNETKQIL